MGSASDQAVHRRRLLFMLSVGYGGSMLAFRPTIMMSLPAMLSDLALTHEDGGVVLTTCQVAYMICKPLAQVVSDSVDGRTLMLGSLFSTGLCCSLVPLAACRWQLQLLMFCLMACQAPHAPAAARMLSNWYGAKERGMAFASLNAAVNLVSCAVPVLVNAVLLASSWHALFFGIGLATLLLGLADLPIVADRPSTACASFRDLPAEEGQGAKAGRGGLDGVLLVLRSRAIWAVGLLFAALYGIRFGLEGWMGTFLRESARDPAAQEAAAGTTAAFLFWWQAGGFVGASLAGPAADYCGGRSLPLAVGFAALLSGALGMVHTADVEGLQASWRLQLAAVLSGACVYGLRLLFNLFTRTQVPTSVAGKADAVVSCLAELGGAFAGFPLIWLVGYAGTWQVYTAALLALAALLGTGCAALLLLCGGPVGPAGEPEKKAQ